MSRNIPASVKRELRQEANFGCAICGFPLIEYHHIEYFSDEEHNDPSRMIALCPNHHSAAGPGTEGITPDRLYEYKQEPFISDKSDHDFF